MDKFNYIEGKGKTYGIGNLKEWIDYQKSLGFVRENKDDYICQCPHCLENLHYEKLKLYITKDFGVGHCFRCNTVFLDSEADKKHVIKGLPTMDQQKVYTTKIMDDERWSLEVFNAFDETSEVGLDYLINKRHKKMALLWRILNFRFFKGNPVIPFYYKGELIYYQIKYREKGRLPYFSPPCEHKPAYIIEHGENTKFVIVEGVFDAIACLMLYPDRTPFAVLGSSITDYQIWMLRSYVPEDILIYMDETEISKKIKDKIVDKLNYSVINIRYSNGEDPEEYYKRKLVEDAELL